LKVCILAPVHGWDDTRVYQKEACTLVEAGYEVTLIAQAPRASVERGVRIRPAPRAGSRLQRFLKLPLVLASALHLRADIYHLHNPDTLPLALLLKLFGKRVIYDTHEDFAQRLLIRAWIPASLRSIAAGFIAMGEALVARIVDATVVTQENVGKRLGRRATLIGNPPVTRGPLIDTAHARAPRIERGAELRLIYAGGIDQARGLDVMIESLARLESLGISARLWLVGSGDEAEIRDALQRPGGRHVDYLGKVEQAEAFAYMLRADIGLATILNVGDHAQTSANKLYEYVVFGLPVVASDFPKWRSTLEPSAAVAFVSPSDPDAIASAVKAIAVLPDRGKGQIEHVRQHLCSHYTWESESLKLLQLYDRLRDSLPA